MTEAPERQPDHPRSGVRDTAWDVLTTARDAGAAVVRSARDVTLDFGRDDRVADFAAVVARNAYAMLVLDGTRTVVHVNLRRPSCSTARSTSSWVTRFRIPSVPEHPSR